MFFYYNPASKELSIKREPIESSNASSRLRQIASLSELVPGSIQFLIVDNVEFQAGVVEELILYGFNIQTFYLSTENEANPKLFAQRLVRLITRLPQLIEVFLEDANLIHLKISQELTDKLNSLIALTMKNCNLQPKQLQKLMACGFLSDQSLLLRLDLCENHFDDGALQALMPVLTHNQYLREIDFGMNSITSGAALSSLTTIMRRNRCMEACSFSPPQPVQVSPDIKGAIIQHFRNHPCFLDATMLYWLGLTDAQRQALNETVNRNFDAPEELLRKMNVMLGLHGVKKSTVASSEIWSHILDFCFATEEHGAKNLPLPLRTLFEGDQQHKNPRLKRYNFLELYPQPLLPRQAKQLVTLLRGNLGSLPNYLNMLLNLPWKKVNHDDETDETEETTERTHLQICWLLCQYLERLDHRVNDPTNNNVVICLLRRIFHASSQKQDGSWINAVEIYILALTELLNSSSINQSSPHRRFSMPNIHGWQPFIIPDHMLHQVLPGQTIVVNGEYYKIKKMGEKDPTQTNIQGVIYVAWPRLMGG